MQIKDSLDFNDGSLQQQYYKPLPTTETFNSLSSNVTYDIPSQSIPSLPIPKTNTASTNLDLVTELKIIYFQPLRPGSLRASIFCLVCVTLGSNMLSLPYFFKTNGVVLTLAIFFLCMYATIWTLKIEVKLAFINKTYDYSGLVSIYFGQKSPMVIYAIIVLLINSLGSIILWNVFISKFLRDFLLYYSFHPSNPELVIYYLSLIILCIIQIPLATFKTLPQFYIMSTLGIFQIVYVICVLIYELPSYFINNFRWVFLLQCDFYYNFKDRLLIQMPFVFINAFGNHSTILSVIDEIKNKTSSRVKSAGKKTVYMEMVIYLITMFASFFSTFYHTKEIFFDRPNLSSLMVFGAFLMLILMICNISLYYYMMLPLLENTFNERKPFTLTQSFICSLVVLTILTYISFYIERVTSLLSFLGASAQVSIIFIIPLMLYMKAKANITIVDKVKCCFAIGFFSLAGMACFIELFYDKIINGISMVWS